jgi:hypothetical protein
VAVILQVCWLQDAWDRVPTGEEEDSHRINRCFGSPIISTRPINTMSGRRVVNTAGTRLGQYTTAAV